MEFNWDDLECDYFTDRKDHENDLWDNEMDDEKDLWDDKESNKKDLWDWDDEEDLLDNEVDDEKEEDDFEYHSYCENCFEPNYDLTPVIERGMDEPIFICDCCYWGF